MTGLQRTMTAMSRSPAKFASEPAALRALRAELPGRVTGSEAGNHEFYVRRVEEGYRQFWRRYCAAQG